MGKLSRLRLRQQSNDKKREEGVGKAELAVLTGGAADRNGENGGTQGNGNDIPLPQRFPAAKENPANKKKLLSAGLFLGKSSLKVTSGSIFGPLFRPISITTGNGGSPCQGGARRLNGTFINPHPL